MIRKTRVALLSLVVASLAGAAIAAPIHLRSGSFEPTGKAMAAGKQGVRAGGCFIVQFRGPVREQDKAALALTGARLIHYIPENSFLVQLRSATLQQIKDLDFVEWVGPLEPQHRLHPELRDSQGGRADILIGLIEPGAATTVAARIDAWHGEVISIEQASCLVRASLPASALDGLSALDEVVWVEPWLQPVMQNATSATITGVQALRSRAQFFGQGQVIAFSDSGLDVGYLAGVSADFAGRIVEAYALRRPGDWSDLVNHGTHVMGCAAGSGILSGSDPGAHSYNGSLCGVAPEAQLIVQSIGDDSQYLFPPLDLTQLLQPAYDGGARVHSNSWGSASGGEYTFYSQQVDNFVWTHPDMVVLFAGGNDGRDANSDGVTDLGSVYAPATSKNCIAVGATEGVSVDGRNTTYGARYGFLAPPISTDHISNNAGGMVAWSSRGPCNDGRMKPDICAPGTNIVSARSHAPGNSPDYWLEYDENYAYWGGTSMATPQVAGAAALVREYYTKEHGTSPSAALVKATLLNGAFDITPGQYPAPIVEVPPRPNMVEGWGRLNLGILDPEAPKVLEFIEETTGATTGAFDEYSFTVSGSTLPLAVTLVWTDPPPAPLAGKQLVNDLDLRITGPTGTLYYGNGTMDHTNNVEGIDVIAPQPGVYTVKVHGTNVPQGPQPYALVVSGELPGSYISGTVTTATGLPVSGATVTASGSGVTRTTTTTSSGNYTMHIPQGDYTVTPSQAGWSFEPVSATVTVGPAGTPGVDFVGSAPAGSISGTITRAVGGPTDYILESEHPYNSRSDIVYTISGHPAASQIRVHFEEAALEEDMDFVYVEDMEGSIVTSITGPVSDVWSEWVPGNTLRVRLVSDEELSDYGFYIDGYETNLVTQGGVEGVTVVAEPTGAATATGADGSYAISGLEPVSYVLTPELDKWILRPSSLPVNVPPGGSASKNFYAFPPSSVTGTVIAGTIGEHDYQLESPHPYPSNQTLTYVIEAPTGSERMRVHFSVLEVEPWMDFVIITDADDNPVATYSEFLSDLWTPWVDGDTIKIVLISDYSLQYDGFWVDRYETLGNVYGLEGVKVTVEGSGESAVTGPGGAYTIPTITAGRRGVGAELVCWSFTPPVQHFNAVAGVPSTGVDFFAQAAACTSVAAIRALPAGTPVWLSGLPTTAGSAEMGGFFYIEDLDRAAGIRVVTTETVPEGSLVEVRGVLQWNDGERQILASDVEVYGTSSETPRPLGMVTRALGGRQVEGIDPPLKLGWGLNNIGLLVTVVGSVQPRDSSSFYLFDGSISKGPIDPEQVRPIVLCPAGVEPPAEGSVVVVTGISSCVTDLGECVPCIRTRRFEDLRSADQANLQ